MSTNSPPDPHDYGAKWKNNRIKQIAGTLRRNIIIKHLSKTILISLLFFSTLYAKDNSEIDKSQYYKLQASNIYFSSIKGRVFFFGIGFDEEFLLAGSDVQQYWHDIKKGSLREEIP